MMMIEQVPPPLFQVPRSASADEKYFDQQEPHFLKTLEMEIAKEQEYRQRLEEENRQMESWLMQKIHSQVEENNRAAMALPISEKPQYKWVAPKTSASTAASKKKEWKDNLDKGGNKSGSISLKSSRLSSMASSARSLNRSQISPVPLPFISGKSTTKSYNNIVQKQNSLFLKKITNPSTLSLKGISSEKKDPQSSRPVSRLKKDDKISMLESELAALNETYQETLNLYHGKTFNYRQTGEKRELELKLKEILKSMEIKVSS